MLRTKKIAMIANFLVTLPGTAAAAAATGSGKEEEELALALALEKEEEELELLPTLEEDPRLAPSMMTPHSDGGGGMCKLSRRDFARFFFCYSKKM